MMTARNSSPQSSSKATPGSSVGTLSRERAAALLAKMDLPSSRNENYRFTSVRDVNLAAEMKAVSERDRLSAEEIESAFGVTAGDFSSWLVQRNSLLVGFESPGELGPGVEAEWVRGALPISAPLDTDVFALATLARTDGFLRVRVKAGFKLERPLATVSWFDELGEASFGTLEVIFEKGSDSVWMDLVGGDSQGRMIQPTAVRTLVVRVEEGARVRWMSVKQPSAHACGFERREVHVASSANLEVLSVAGSGDKHQTRTEIMLEGSDAEFKSFGVVRGREEQHWDEWVHVHHLASRTLSNLEHRAVVEGKARSVFNAQIGIRPGVRGCEAYQRNPNLLMSAGAQVETFPRLLISNDEVKCAHGATVASIAPEQLYYLQSRGISREEAERMIVEGFVESVLQRAPSPLLRSACEKVVVG
jgi:Fe-S cluster assembly scaffold protein SufB